MSSARIVIAQSFPYDFYEKSEEEREIIDSI